MSKKKPTPDGRAKKKAEVSLVRSSAAEYLTFVAASGQGGVEAVYADENVWLSQKMMGLLYDVETNTVNYHLKKIFADNELQEDSVLRNFRITAADGKTYDTQHYNLSAIIAVGYKVNSERAVQFRKWATGIIESFTIKGYAMDDERLKNDGSILGKQYFEEQLQRIREIRLSERKFYQKITDIYATSIDYDVTAAATKRFFATVQNKLHWAIHAQTAAEVILSRAEATKDRMGLTTWRDAPTGKIQKFDVVVAKNYLTETEMAQLQRLASAYLDVAEDMALRQIPMTMQDWETRLNRFIAATDREILQDAGKVTAEIAVRELVANALIHQDFNESGTSVMVELYDDRMEISNPGQPFISPDRFIDEYQSRNERLADLMRRLGICEEKGSGVDKVIQAAEAFQLPAPDFRVGEKRTSVVLFGHKDFENMDRNDRIRATYQHCCLRYVMNEKMTNQSLRERFRLSEKKTESASRAIRDAVEAGKIKLADPEQTSLRYRNYVPFWA